MTRTDARDQSRREFLAASAVGVLGMAALAREAAPDSELAYVGTYTDATHREGVYRVTLSTRTGKLRLLDAIDAGPSPSFLAIHPNGAVLYAVNEVADGSVSGFALAPDTGALTSLGRQSSGGRGPCFVSVDRSGRAALVANYDNGIVALLPIAQSGALRAPASVLQQSGRGPNAERQNGPHAHCILTDPANRFAIAADLGADRVFVYELDLEAGVLRHREVADAVMRAGSGPRHLAFHPSLPLVFVSCELDSTVAALRFDPDSGKLSLLSTLSTVPSRWKGENYPADVHVAPLGNVLYVSNRGHDSIAVFSIDSMGSLRLEQAIGTEAWPRNFSLDPTGSWLLVANQNSHSIVVFARDRATGRLATTSHRLQVPSPTCIHFRGPTRT